MIAAVGGDTMVWKQYRRRQACTTDRGDDPPLAQEIEFGLARDLHHGIAEHISFEEIHGSG